MAGRIIMKTESKITLINNLINYTGNDITVYTQNLYDGLLRYDFESEKISIYDYIGSGNLKIKGMKTFKKQVFILLEAKIRSKNIRPCLWQTSFYCFVKNENKDIDSS